MWFFVMLRGSNLSYLPNSVFALILLVSLDIARIRSNKKFYSMRFSCLSNAQFMMESVSIVSSWPPVFSSSIGNSILGTLYSFLNIRFILPKSIAANLLVSELSMAGPLAFLRNPLILDFCSEALLIELELKT